MNEPELRILRSILSALHSIKQSIDAQAKQNRAEQNQNNTPQQVDIQSEIHLPPAISDYYRTENSERKKKNRWERVRVLLDVGAFTAAVLAAIFTYRTLSQVTRQADIMSDTLGEVRKQTTLIRQQVVGSEGAIVEPLVDISVGDITQQQGSNVNIFLKNTGRVISTPVHLKADILRISIPAITTIGKPLTFEFSTPPLRPTSADHPQDPVIRPYRLRVSHDEFVSIHYFHTTVFLKGTLTYGNGFGDTIEFPICYALLTYSIKRRSGNDINAGSGTTTCDQFMVNLPDIMREIQVRALE